MQLVDYIYSSIYWESDMNYTVTDIEYDDAKGVDLPETLEITVPSTVQGREDTEQYISDEISERTGYCHKGFSITPKMNVFETLVNHCKTINEESGLNFNVVEGTKSDDYFYVNNGHKQLTGGDGYDIEDRLKGIAREFGINLCSPFVETAYGGQIMEYVKQELCPSCLNPEEPKYL